VEQAKAQSARILDATTTSLEKEQAARLRREAEQQIELLRDSGSGTMSDFYVYRYLASEGWLPGYNFPRLPLSAYLPGQRGKDEYLSRPRFLAISEFGPGAVVYHEGSRYLVDKVLMPAKARMEGGQVATRVAKLCAACGYIHSDADAETADVCDRCATSLGLDSLIPDLFALEAVSLRRRDRITCDEEERMRQGYEIRTGIRFQGRPGDEQCQRADLVFNGESIATLTYAQTATIWRVNVGWNRRQDETRLGYQLDVDRGKWLSDEGANALMSEDSETTAQRVQRVVPYVADRRNALVLEWMSELSAEESASLQAALKSAIQVVFQLEDSEIAAEPLPNSDKRRCLLLYEAAEGGAGVLRRLVDDGTALRRVARAALDICHFDPDTAEDRGKHERAREQCSAACYDCLMSYGNQRDHLVLDRHVVRDLLLAIRDGDIKASSGGESRAARLDRLLSLCDSNLEKSWLKHLEDRGLGLPTYAQYRIPECGTRPDFAYVHGAMKVAVYVDGPPHDYPLRQMRDAAQDMVLMLKGWIVHRFHHEDDWQKTIAEHPSTYGVGQ
jgi:very-short-patch-repair endonuclease